MVNIIRNEDYENEQSNAEAGLGASGLRGAMEMKKTKGPWVRLRGGVMVMTTTAAAVAAMGRQRQRSWR